MPKSAMIRARMEPDLKDRAEAMLEQLGLSATSAITLFYRQIIQRRGLPFDLRIPNAATRRVMQDTRSGRGVVKAGSMDDLFAKLDGNAKKPARAAKRRARSVR
jgi:DNA-damage-inducible protein J